MGSNLGRSFACLFVSYQEEKIFQSYQGPIPELFKRFVDDGIGAKSMPRSDHILRLQLIMAHSRQSKS